jgi:hypothetical protein
LLADYVDMLDIAHFSLFEVQLIYLTLGISCLQVTVIMLREFVLFFDVEVIGMTWDETFALRVHCTLHPTDEA